MFVKIDDVKTSYQKIGKSKPLLYLLHGWGGDWQSWHPVIIELSKKYTLIIPDLPSFGQSNEPKKVWGIPKFAAWLQSFINKTSEGKKYFLMGHSFGGQIASNFAGEKQDKKLKKLILVDSAGLAKALSKSNQAQMSMLGLIPTAIKDLIPKNLKQKILEALGKSTDHLNSSNYQKRVLRKVVHYSVADSLLKITVPTILIWGEDDQDTPVHMAEQFAQLIANNELFIIENAGHFVFIDKTPEFLDILEKKL